MKIKKDNLSFNIRNMDHVTVCICTFKRPIFLKRLLGELRYQETEGLFKYSLVVVDNDYRQSAKKIVSESALASSISIIYSVECEQNIALARNKAVANAKGELIAFIDDDEIPSRRWLINLYRTYIELHADGVLGPVIPYYETNPPNWVIRGKFYERPSHKTGEILHWTNTQTGNLLVKRQLFSHTDNLFKRQFGSGGEDRDFFKRMISKGYHFIWCAEAPVFETITAERCKRSFMLRRALLRGKAPHYGIKDVGKSIIAVPLYAAILPSMLLAGHHLFMKYLIKEFDHIGRLLACFGMNPIKEKYITG